MVIYRHDLANVERLLISMGNSAFVNLPSALADLLDNSIRPEANAMIAFLA